MNAIVEVSDLSKIYHADRPEIAVHAMAKVSFSIGAGESLAIIGPSGCGKSTLLHVLGCLDRPTAGRYLLSGLDVSALDDDALAQVRNAQIGFVFQSFQLLPRLNAVENVTLPLLYQRPTQGHGARRCQALETLDRVGLGDRTNHLPAELSGGQCQRVAIARALVTAPAMLLCDEPTGALDSHTGAEVMSLLRELNRAGTTLVVVTHDLDVARAMTRAIWMRDGRLVMDGPSDALASAMTAASAVEAASR